LKVSRNFKDSFKNQLLKETGYWTSANNTQTWSPANQAPPFKSMTGWTGLDRDPIGKEQQELPHDGEMPLNLPFPLGNIIEYLADAYMAITKTEISIKTCIDQNIVVVGEKEILLRKQLLEIQKLKANIQNISAQIEKLTLNI